MIKHKIIFGFIFTIILTTLSAQNEVNKFDKNGERHGIWQKNYPSTSQIRYKGKFIHGKEIDTFKYYKLKQKKSVLSAVKVFNSNDNKSEVTFLASNGSIVSKGKMEGKNFIGKWIYFHKNSDRIMIEENYNYDGKLDGKRNIYFTNGNVAEEVTYINGIQDGVSKVYSQSGKLLQSSNYKRDELNGISTYYDSDGNVKANGSFKNNLKTGIWTYYKNGELVRKVDHDTDKILFKKQ